MTTQNQTQTPTRRPSDPHYRHHVQPKYPAPPRRNTEGALLTKVHSRPEDYKNKPRPERLFEYICFDGAETPQEHDEHKHHDEKTQLDRTESHDTSGSSMTVESENYDGDSEDDLALPSTYHHDIAHKHEYASWGRQTPDAKVIRQNADREEDHHHRTAVPQQQHTHEHVGHRHDSSSESRSRRHSSTGSEHSDNLIAQVAQHLQSHKHAYKKNHSASEIVNELLGEVVRKVSDGGLEDGQLMKEVLREVQHVL